MSNKRLEEIKKRYPRAYERWTPEEDTLLQEKYAQGMKLIELADIFERQPSAISSRLFKFRFGEQRNDLNFGAIEAVFAFEWEPLLRDANEHYFFPSPITGFMKKNYRRPVIYRWVIDYGQDENLYYIGETTKLCPERLSGYLSPGPSQQTNIRLNRQFHESISSGAKVSMELLKLNGSFLDDLEIQDADLKRQDVRRLIERLLIVLYRNRGLQILNL